MAHMRAHQSNQAGGERLASRTRVRNHLNINCQQTVQQQQHRERAQGLGAQYSQHFLGAPVHADRVRPGKRESSDRWCACICPCTTSLCLFACSTHALAVSATAVSVIVFECLPVEEVSTVGLGLHAPAPMRSHKRCHIASKEQQGSSDS